jgi:anti-anti-sigma factor
VKELLEVRVETRDDIAVGTLAGEMDISNARAAGDEIAAALGSHNLGAVIDLTGLTFVDSAGVRVLFELETRLLRARQRLVLVLTESSPVRRVLKIAGLLDVVSVATRVDEGLELVREPPDPVQ